MRTTQHERKLIQRAINEIMDTRLTPDGAIGPASLSAIEKYRAAYAVPGRGVDESLWNALLPHITRRFVQIGDIVNAAKEIGVLPSMALAIWEKESRGSGFLADKRCTLLFERHIFYKYAVEMHGRVQAEKWRKEYPNICHPSWDQTAYFGGAGEYRRLEQARLLDATIALMSCSWGLFQLMGFNFNYTRFRDVQSMVLAFDQTEHEHLAGFIGFIVGQPALHRGMTERNFHTVGRVYNGRSYASHGYHTDLERIEKKYLPYNNL